MALARRGRSAEVANGRYGSEVVWPLPFPAPAP